jgi:hypothetical protein
MNLSNCSLIKTHDFSEDRHYVFVNNLFNDVVFYVKFYTYKRFMCLGLSFTYTPNNICNILHIIFSSVNQIQRENI